MKEQIMQVLKDEDILEGFKNIQEIIKAQKELNHAINERLKLLEASQFKQPLVLTKEMEVKN